MKRLLRLFLVTCLMLLGITFAILNSEFVVVHYYLGTQKLPLSVVMLITWVLGIVIGLLFTFPTILKLKLALRRQPHDSRF